MKRLTNEEIDALHSDACYRCGDAYLANISIAKSNLIIIELLQRQMEGKK